MLTLLFILFVIYVVNGELSPLNQAWSAAAYIVYNNGVTSAHKELFDFYFGLAFPDYTTQQTGSNENTAEFPEEISGDLKRVLKENKIRVGGEPDGANLVPFYSQPAGLYRGFDYDYVRMVVAEISSHYGEEIEIEFVGANAAVDGFFNRVVDGLQTSCTIDVYGTALTVRESRAEIIDFASVSYYATYIAILVRGDFANMDLDQLKQQTMLRIGYSAGSTAEPVALDQFPDAVHVPTTAGVNAQSLLDTDAADALVGDLDTLRSYNCEGCKLFQQSLTGDNDYFAAAFLKPDDTSCSGSDADADDDDSSDDDSSNDDSTSSTD